MLYTWIIYPKDCTSPDIQAVTYSTNGKNLNATIWLLGAHNFGHNTSFTMFLSPLSGPTYYGSSVVLDGKTNSWTRLVTQLTSPSNSSRILEMQVNDTDVNESYTNENKSYVNLHLDLSNIGSASQYQVAVLTKDTFFEKGNLYKTKDFVNPVIIPPPKFDMTVLPTPIEVRQNDIGTVEVILKSNINLGSNVSLSGTPSSDLAISISPPSLFVPAYGIASFIVQSYASGGAEVNSTYTVPVHGDFYFPSVFGGLEGRGNIKQPFNLTATILQPLPLVQYSFPIPEQYLIPFYALIPSFLIPSVARMINGRRQRNILKKLNNEIDDSFTSAKGREQRLEDIDNLMKEVTDSYTDGKISDTHYGILKDKLSKYEEKSRED
jgi:hypothetical protein